MDKFGDKAMGKQNSETGDFNKGSKKLDKNVSNSPKFDEAYLNSLIHKARNTWRDIDPDIWLSEIRGDYEE